MNGTAYTVEARISDVALDGARILCVDDDDSSLIILTSFLKREGCGCETAEDGAKALEMLRRDSAFDLVITDVVMPVLDGHDLCSAIEREFPGMRVVVVSGSPEEDVAPLRTCGVVCDVLSKPLRRRDIMDVVLSALNSF